MCIAVGLVGFMLGTDDNADLALIMDFPSIAYR